MMGRLLLDVMRSRWILVAGTTAFGVAASMGYAALAPERFRAQAVLFTDVNSAVDAGAPGTSAGHGVELDLLRSERVAQRVVENERLLEEPALRGLYLESIDAGRPPVDAVAEYLADHVRAAAGADGGVVRLAVTLGSAELAARVANGYAQAWGEVDLELRAAAIRGGVERAHDELTSLRARLGQARARQGDSASLAAAGSRADEEFAQLSRMTTRNVYPATVQLASLAVGAAGTRAAPADLPSDAPGAIRLEPGAGAMGEAKVRAQAKTPDDDIRFAQQSLERAEERLAQLSAEGIGAPFPVHILRAAEIPSVSIKPAVEFCLCLGAIAGLLLGMLAAGTAEAFDRRVRRASDLARGLGLVVLGTMPAARSANVQQPPMRPIESARWLRFQRSQNTA